MNTAVARTTSQTMRVTQKGEESAAQWIKGVLDGSGSSPAQIIVAVVIGCIPFVGQRGRRWECHCFCSEDS